MYAGNPAFLPFIARASGCWVVTKDRFDELLATRNDRQRQRPGCQQRTIISYDSGGLAPNA